jgi:orotate phosphoribosyltransferase
LSSDETARKVAEILLDIKAVALNTKEPFKFVSGIFSPIYTDNRLLMSYPEQRKTVMKLMADKAEAAGIEFDVVAGVASSGIPLAAWLAAKFDKPMVYIRKASKDYGTQKLIEGKLEQGQKVLLVEDLISSGGSSLRAVDALREAGATVEKVMVIFTYGMEKSVKGFAEKQVELIPLTNFDALVEVAAEKDYIKDEDKEKVLDWAKAPGEWGKKMGFE